MTGLRNKNYKRVSGARKVRRIGKQVQALSRMIETKEGCRRITNVQLGHNNLTVFNDSDGNVFNPFLSTQGASDPMSHGSMARLGDKITVRGIKLKFMVEASLGRTKVYFKFFLVKMAKGDTLNRANFFKDACGNKMIDQVNTERFTVLASKTFNVTAPNNTVASGLPGTTVAIATGLPLSQGPAAITGNRVFDLWIPGAKFGRGGNVSYENSSVSQVKFYDYRLCCVAYDWYGTPQDTNNVGFINDGYCKIYFKDA